MLSHHIRQNHFTDLNHWSEVDLALGEMVVATFPLSLHLISKDFDYLEKLIKGQSVFEKILWIFL